MDSRFLGEGWFLVQHSFSKDVYGKKLNPLIDYDIFNTTRPIVNVENI